MVMPWIGKPYRDLPPPIVLKNRDKLGYMSGVKEEGWIRWKSQQRVAERHFMHKDWYNLPFGFEGTRNLVTKLSMDIEKGRRSSLKDWATRKGVDLEEANYDVFAHKMVDSRSPGIKVFSGGTPCLLWQVGLGGSWCLVSRYGVIEGLDVSIREDVEWQLRHGLMIGFIYFLGIGVRSHRDRTIRKLMAGKTVWDWNDVGLMIWGMGETLPSKKGKYISLAGEKWRVLPGYVGKLRVGGYKSAILDNMFLGDEKGWKSFVEGAVNNGYHLGYQTDNGFRYQTGWGIGEVTQEYYDTIYEKVRDFG